MSNRWKMNRIGFVNFWLYDEEDFTFVDGKLLLRGQNGSGKSITTQSFIPFVLDGDRTPSRLDPFGSSDRRMEYYFLGEEGKDESTGYLFLEFQKADTQEYRTIGIGQRAKRGKPMDFWGFLLLDGRRIGYDLWLYKEVGSTKIPYDKRDLKLELGEGNPLTGSQSEYKKLVNQYIFGFRKAEQYEQFIKLLVKVRAPKLSKEFKPTKVYEILNDSLQTLTDEDLRPMVDAMEKMDEIQDSLEMLNRAFADVKIIRNEYTRYNQYMLGKKAQAYLGKKQEAEEAKRQLEAQKQRRQEMLEKQRAGSERLEELREQRRLYERERDGLMDSDMEEMDHKLAQARRAKEEAGRQAERWEEKAEEYRESILRGEQRLLSFRSSLEQRQQELLRQKQELEEQQELLRWERHEEAVSLLGAERCEGTEELGKALAMYKTRIEQCRQAIRQYEEASSAYDEAADALEQIKKQKIGREQQLQAAQEQVTVCVDEWITGLFAAKKGAVEWKPGQDVLTGAQEQVRGYQSVSSAGAVRELLRADYERQRQALLDVKSEGEREKRLYEEALRETREELALVRRQEELVPKRDENANKTREALRQEGITAVPFYKAVEFAEGLDKKACARMEAQLCRMGILDALVVSDEDLRSIEKRCPQFLDALLYVKERGSSRFSKLTVSDQLSGGLREVVLRILSNLHEKAGEGAGIYLSENGTFRQGMLAGRADQESEAQFVGQLARKRRKEQKIRELQERVAALEELITRVQNEILHIIKRLEKLQEEYRSLPDFSRIDAALAREKECSLELQMVSDACAEREKRAYACEERKNQQYQVVLQRCKPFPYGRTEAEYEEVSEGITAYQEIWQTCRELLFRIEAERERCMTQEERIEQEEQAMDDAFMERRLYTMMAKEHDIQIRQLEEYLNRPENIERANRLNELRGLLEANGKESDEQKTVLVRLDERLRALRESEPEQRRLVERTAGEEKRLGKYFEEELSLKLVFAQNGETLGECARKAAGVLRDSDKSREAGDMLQSLYQVYQKYNGSLANYGTSLEDCFETAEAYTDGDSGALRRRVRVVSVWNGKKVYLEEFYGILKASIDETELLIQQRDRELFEDILSQTISQQLTDKIAESRKWVGDMSRLMKEMDTSMGLCFSLDWRPRTADNEAELDTAELEQILLRDHTLLTVEDIEKVASHFRSKIRMEKQRLEESDGLINYMELVRDALDYRRWFDFRMYFKRGGEGKKPLTNAAFNRFSGGEKAMAMYVPLFAAVNAQYKKAENKDHPRMIALDEAFAGVDDKNISSMFALVQKLDFDYIMNSQSLWGCFDTVRGIRIAELLRPMNSQIVTIIRYTWNGREKVLDEQ